MRTLHRGLAPLLAIVITAMLWQGCRLDSSTAVDDPLPPSAPFDLGAEAYAILDANLARADECPAPAEHASGHR